MPILIIRRAKKNADIDILADNVTHIFLYCSLKSGYQTLGTKMCYPGIMFYSLTINFIVQHDISALKQ